MTGGLKLLSDSQRRGLERELWGPLKRSARRVGIGVGKVVAWAVLLLGLGPLLGGVLLMALASGIGDTIGAILVTLGFVSCFFGALGIFGLGKFGRHAEIKDIEMAVHRGIAGGRTSDSGSIARELRCEKSQVEAVAREMALAGSIERDIDTARRVELYRLARDPSAADPRATQEAHARDLEAFEARLGATTQAHRRAVQEESEELEVNR